MNFTDFSPLILVIVIIMMVAGLMLVAGVPSESASNEISVEVINGSFRRYVDTKHGYICYDGATLQCFPVE